MVKRVLSLVALLLCLTVLPAAGADKKFTLVIDAGHGGNDAGAIGSISKEKNINLNIALAFGRLVETQCPDVRVVYTRKRDVFIPLYERAEIANRQKADLFISIHTNALPNGHIARGFETYTLGDGTRGGRKTNLDVAKRENSVIFLEKDYQEHYVGFDPNSPESNIMFEFVQDRNLTQSIELAKMLQKNVCKMAGRQDKGVHQDNFAVLRLTSMPACLIELGFISTPDEERQLNDPTVADLMAKGIFNAFAEYKNKYYHSMTVPFKTETTPITNPTPATAPEPQPEKPSETKPEPAKPEEKTPADDSRPVFKIQIIAGNMNLRSGDQHFKGLMGCECYEENGMKKYTYGASNDYNEIYRLRKTILDKFPEAFIIAFKNGKKVNVNEAIREFKNNRNK